MKNVASFFTVSHKGPSMADLKVYKAGRPTNNENLVVQNGRFTRIL
jgi:hypothetical protein